ncbi:MAG: UDP-glucuronic acid decarboxylase family protein [Rickettsiales bacterium]
MGSSVKNILVAGGAGFIGFHLCSRLLAQGHNVVAVDNFFTGSSKNIEPLFSSGRFSVIEHDITIPYAFLSKDGSNFDEIYNLACPASPVHYQPDPVRTMMVNILGMKNLLDLAKTHNARILQTSTSEVYGDPKVHPQSEDYSGNVTIIGPRACYDEGKRAAETLCFDYHRQYKTDIKVVRIFNTYGPFMRRDDGRVVSNFICQALAGEPITIYGDGSQTRSFCYIDDIVEGIIRMMESASGIVGPVNLGNPDEFTIEELAEKILEKTGGKSSIIYKPLPQDDPAQRQPDIRLAKELLGWQPKTSLDRGLDKAIAYFAEK